MTTLSASFQIRGHQVFLRLAPIILGFVVVLAAPRGVAQSCIVTEQCEWTSWNSGCQPQFPPGAYNCHTVAPFVAQCQLNRCAKNASAETCPTCPSAGSPISLATGDTFIEQSDVRVPGVAGGLSLTRTWNSKWPTTQSGMKNGMFGPNWRATFEERVFLGGDGTMKYARSDGSFWSFGFSNYVTQSGIVVGSAFTAVAPANQTATLTLVDPTWTIAFQNGETRIFSSASGSLTSIIDRNGNTTQLTYDSANRLATVTDAAGRHLNFTYASSFSNYLVTGLNSDVGISLSYAYDAQGRLATVTKPDQTFVTFDYDANSLITAVKDSNGKILESHTYDALGRGLTSSRANGVDAVSISYPKPSPPN